MNINLKQLETEQRNENTYDIDSCSTLDIVKKINQEDKKVADAVEKQLPQISKVIDECSKRLKDGGRLIYIGAGTSGRLGVVDAAECPPTYGVSKDLVIGLIAGGEKAMFAAQEGAEDSIEDAIKDLKDINLNNKDCVIGIAASGRTPYVIGGLKYAKEIGAFCASIACVSNAKISEVVDVPVEVITGAEAITGSTRMKAATAEKMICNMISTGCMIRYGKIYENLMVDVQPTNNKLVTRAKQIIATCVKCDIEQADRLFDESKGDVKLAIIMGISKQDYDKAKVLLNSTCGNVHEAILKAEKL